MNRNLAKKVTAAFVDKYDISQKILKQLSDLEARTILFSIINKPKLIKEISKEEKIPLSSVYTKMEGLKNCSLVIGITDFSIREQSSTWYQSKIKDVKIRITKFEPKILFNKNPKLRQ